MTFLGHNKKFWYSVAALIAGMVGVGMFSLPFAFAKAGFFVGAGLLILIAAETLLVDLMYGEVILRTHERHQIIGYTRKYLPSFFEKIVIFSILLTGYAGLLAYIIISGDFIHTLFLPFFSLPLQTYSIIFWIIVSAAVLRGLRSISIIELILTVFLLIITCLFCVDALPHLMRSNLMGVTWQFVSLPYGVLIFAFGGLIALPIQRQILRGQERDFRRSIWFAILITAIVYGLFSLAVVGASGPSTSPDAITGLFPYIGGTIALLGAFFGLITITISYLMLGAGMKDTFHLDFKMRRFSSWTLVVLPPITLFLLGLRTFVDVIGFAGAVALGIEQIIIVFLYAKAKSYGDRIPEYSLGIPAWLLYIITIIFLCGITYYLFLK